MSEKFKFDIGQVVKIVNLDGRLHDSAGSNIREMLELLPLFEEEKQLIEI